MGARSFACREKYEKMKQFAYESLKKTGRVDLAQLKKQFNFHGRTSHLAALRLIGFRFHSYNKWNQHKYNGVPIQFPRDKIFREFRKQLTSLKTAKIVSKEDADFWEQVEKRKEKEDADFVRFNANSSNLTTEKTEEEKKCLICLHPTKKKNFCSRLSCQERLLTLFNQGRIEIRGGPKTIKNPIASLRNQINDLERALLETPSTLSYEEKNKEISLLSNKVKELEVLLNQKDENFIALQQRVTAQDEEIKVIRKFFR